MQDFPPKWQEQAEKTEKITEKLQIAESTVKTQRQRAKQYLRKRLKNLYTLVIFLFFE